MKNYNFALKESLRLCLASSRVMTLEYLIIKILLTILPSIQIILLSKLIGLIESSPEDYNSIFSFNLVFLILVIMVIWLSKSTQLSILECLKIKIKEIIGPILITKRTNLPLNTLEDEKTNELIHRVCFEIEENICDAFEATIGIISLIFQVAGILLVLMQQVCWIALIILFIMLPLVPITIKNSLNKYQQDMKVTKLRRQFEYLSYSIVNREEALERELFHTNSFLSNLWNEKYEEARIIKNCNEKKWYMKVQGASLVTQALFMLIILILGIYTRLGFLNVGIFVAFIPTTFDLVLITSWDLHDYINKTVTAKEYFQEYKKFLNLNEFNEKSEIVIERIEDIEFRDVSFKYPNSDIEVIKHLSCRFRENNIYFLIGINGAGKSTIIKLILGFYDTYQGEILINGTNLKQINFRSLYEKVSVSFQDFVRFNLDAKSNVLLGNKKSDEINFDEERFAQDDFFKKVSATEKTLGKEYTNGIGLSGGEWQKISIFRTILKRCDMKIFDEPTAFIDPLEETKLIQMMKDSCVLGIFITHRLSLIDSNDQIIVIKDGTVIEKGSKNELLNNDSYFKKLLDLQRSWYK